MADLSPPARRDVRIETLPDDWTPGSKGEMHASIVMLFHVHPEKSAEEAKTLIRAQFTSYLQMFTRVWTTMQKQVVTIRVGHCAPDGESTLQVVLARVQVAGQQWQGGLCVFGDSLANIYLSILI